MFQLHFLYLMIIYDSNKMAVLFYKLHDITDAKISLSEEISLRSFYLESSS